MFWFYYIKRKWKFDSLEMLDKVEPPAVADGFGISLAYGCLVDIVRSVSLAVLGPTMVNI